MPLKLWSVDSVTLNFLEGKRSSPSIWYCHMKKSGAIRIQCNQAANDHPQSTRLSTAASRAAASRRDFRITIRTCCRKKILLATKQVKSANRIIEPLIQLYIYKRREFHRLNHSFISSRTGKIIFSLLSVTLQKKIRFNG